MVVSSEQGVILVRQVGGRERGVSLVTAAIVLPLVLILVFLIVELGRILMAYAFVQEVLGQTLKFASSRAPYAATIEVEQDLYSPTEAAGDPLHERRKLFWLKEVANHGGGGKQYFTAREKQVFNLAYGAMLELEPTVYFPIPADGDKDSFYQDLQGHLTCSLSFRFAPNDAWNPPGTANVPPEPLPQRSDSNYTLIMNADRNRIYTLECRVPLVGPRFFRQFLGSDFVTLRSSVYAYRSGGITP